MERKECEANPYGIVRVERLADTAIATSDRGEELLVEQATYLWTPSIALEEDLPNGFQIAFDVSRYPDGLRRFAPDGGLNAFEPRAWLAGLAVLSASSGLSADYVFSYQAMHLVFGRAQHVQAHLDRAFCSPADLIVRRGGRGGGVEATILPESLGKDAAGRGQRWSVTRLLQEGRERAVSDGVTNCSQAQAIAYGLMVAAERNPLEVTDADAETLVRMALFDCEASGATPTQACLGQVQARLLAAIEKHQDDEQDDFDNWFRGGKSNLPKSLANQAKATGGRLDLAAVQAALLELVWKSYRYEATCLNAFAQAFIQALPDPLSAEERNLFAQMYQPQPYLGGLPLALVSERSLLLRPVLLSIWTSPSDQKLWKVLWRLLQYYAEMISRRRRADRQSKTRPLPLATSRSTIDPSSLEAKELAEELGTKGGMRCARLDCLITFSMEVDPSTEASILITANCKEHGNLKPLELSRDVAKGILEVLED